MPTSPFSLEHPAETTIFPVSVERIAASANRQFGATILVLVENGHGHFAIISKAVGRNRPRDWPTNVIKQQHDDLPAIDTAPIPWEELTEE